MVHIISLKYKIDYQYRKCIFGCPTSFNFGFTDFLIYINDMPQTANSKLLLYVDDTCPVFQHKDIKTTEEGLSRDFEL